MKKTIGKKLVFTYLILILVTLTASGILFTTFIKKYIISEAMASLHSEANQLVELVNIGERGEISPGVRTVLTKIAFRTIESDYLIVQRGTQNVVLTSSQDIAQMARFPVPLTDAFAGKGMEGQSKIGGKEIVYVALPMYTMKHEPASHVMVLFTELQQIQNITYDVVKVLIKGFLLTAAVMLVISYFMMRSLTRPLQNIRHSVNRLMTRDFTLPEIVKTGDELEELSQAFRDMTLELKQYDEAQRRFLQNASHELKTPLMAIQGYAEGVRDGIFREEDAEKGLDVISTESKRLKKIVDELIYLSKLETLDGMFDLQTVHVKNLLEESIIRVNSLAMQKGIDVSLISDSDCSLKLDPDKTIQAFINIIGNGISHAKSSVTVRIQKMDSVLRITVEDDGSGFREEEKEHIFERFFHGHDGDTGLGLAITKTIIQKSGGTIRAENGQNGGAIFTVLFTS